MRVSGGFFHQYVTNSSEYICVFSPLRLDKILTNIGFHFINRDPSFGKNLRVLALSTEELEAIILHWNAINNDGRFFNGAVLAATSIDPLPGSPILEVGLTDYAHYLYAASHPGTATPCRNVFCAALIVTADDRLILGEMASKTAAPGKLQLVGGNVEISPTGNIDSRECCIREIFEEVGNGFVSAIETFSPFCIKTGGQLQSVGIFYLARISMTANEAQQSFEIHQEETRQRNEQPEFARLNLVELNQIQLDTFCDENSGRMVDYLAPLLSGHLANMTGNSP